jgi:quercetin dioxygenase-like cupin family protein
MNAPTGETIDIAALLAQARHDGPLASVTSAQLNVNLLRLAPGDVIAEHANAEVDVLLVILGGSGELVIDGAAWPLRAGQLAVVPRGASRSLRCGDEPLVYVSCHQRRGGLLPT